MNNLNIDTAADRMERALYIEKMTEDLSRLASDSGLPVLHYLLCMAREEALIVQKSERSKEVEAVDTPRRGRPIRSL